MKLLSLHQEEIVERIRKEGCVLMLDFDGVLSPLVRRPDAARIAAVSKKYLRTCAKKYPTAVISGRALADLESRLGVLGVHTAGSHGLEWRLAGAYGKREISAPTRARFAAAKKEMLAVAKEFPRLHVEEKYYCIALGDQLLSARAARQARKRMRTIAARHRRYTRVLDAKGTFELVAATSWTKGDCVRFFYRNLARSKRTVAVYIGDSLTDEDVFSELKEGITIRVGKTKTSAARFYCNRRGEVDAFLLRLIRT